MLTPELLALAVVSEPDWCNCTLATGEIDLDRLRAHIAEALRIYARAERERCVQVAESFIPSGFRDGSLEQNTGHTYHRLPLGDIIGVARDDRARVIAHAIRALDYPPDAR